MQTETPAADAALEKAKSFDWSSLKEPEAWLNMWPSVQPLVVNCYWQFWSYG